MMGIMRVSLVLLAIFLVSLMQKPVFAGRKSYVVYFGGHSHGPRSSPVDSDRITESHYVFLSSFLGSREKAKEAMFYSYTRHINGFAANLHEEEAADISKHPEVVSVFLNEGKELHTTQSWEFLGLERNGEITAESIWAKARFGEDVIIGNLDTGVWPESESFNDEGMGPIPSKWKGYCETKDTVRCNRKLIGARYFHKGYEAFMGPINSTFDTARDDLSGHGTHTLSTAGGRFVAGANFLGMANGTAKGGSPNARVASYKVCWPVGIGFSCFDADLLAAFDAAIHDGVDVLSVSVGGRPKDYFLDGIAIGSFHAVKKGMVVVCSGGNSGPRAGTISNLAPWIITVAASTMDRELPSYVTLGNNKQYKGSSFSTRLMPEKFCPMIRSIDAKAANASRHNASLCFVGSLDPAKVKGKIVSCLRRVNGVLEKGFVVAEAGGIGMILIDQPDSSRITSGEPYLLPTSHVSAADGLAIVAYIKSTKSPVAYITGGTTELNTQPAPFMIDFSSQGPNTITPEILKPDITAPGVNVLAAYTQAVGPSRLPFDMRRVPYYFKSGTSMSCPHISGIAGLLKTLHPNWSSAAIKSAIMTTASTRDNIREPIVNFTLFKATPFNYGAGHVRPNSAMDPGLVYDLTITDYLNFLCSLGYNTTQMKEFIDDEPYTCNRDSIRLVDFNYPSISIPKFTRKITVTRTLKNVGTPGTYSVRIHDLSGISVTVKPKTLKFETIGEEKKFKVTLEAKSKRSASSVGNEYVFGGLIWSDGEHHVRSPIVVKAAANANV